MSDDNADFWDEVFEDLHVKSVPIEYLIEIQIFLSDGRTIVFDIDHKKFKKFEDLEEDLDNLTEQYDDLIEKIDFRVDTEKVKKDIIKITRAFTKKAK